MNYYEELGIHPDATTGEIREAYKLAVRLVHPDKQLDPRLKKLAECQMKRLSDVVAVLVDQGERARYDARLAGGRRPERPALPAPASRPALLETAVRHWFWVLLGSMTMGMGVWYALAGGAETPSGDAAVESIRTPARPVVEPGDRTPVGKRPEKISKVPDGAKLKPSLPSWETLAEEPQPNVSAPASTAVSTMAFVAKLAPQAEPVEQNVRPDAPEHAAMRFTGAWLYAADGREDDRTGTYTARYVELRLREAGGTLAGEYRAVHRVPDKAISPEVAFRVSGESPQGTSGKLEWESSGGAKGELELTLKSPDQLQVTWWTTQFGKREALSSGMAVLMRLKTP